jgi:pheromone a factor receptor
MLAPGLSRGRYLRLMAIAGVEMLATIPLGTYLIVYDSKRPMRHWISWADTHSDYSTVYQIPAFIWKNDAASVYGLELFRWSPVACAFIFFALFGFADEAFLHYRRAYTLLASRLGFSTFTLHGSSYACVVHVGPSKLIGADPLLLLLVIHLCLT